jgi:hypothetical protein
MNSSQAALATPSDWQQPTAANSNDATLSGLAASLQAELAAQEPVVGAAVLVATAFRLRDEAGLTRTLRLLTEAIDGLERRRAREEG